MADGLVSRETVEFAMNVLWRYLDDVWLVSERDILSAVHTLLESAHVLTEPSGAVGLAALWTQRANLSGKRIVIVLTGSNSTTGQLDAALAAPPFVALAQ